MVLGVSHLSLLVAWQPRRMARHQEVVDFVIFGQSYRWAVSRFCILSYANQLLTVAFATMRVA